MAKCALYRHFSKSNELLYVGVSNNPLDRTVAHGCNATWFEQVVRIDIEWFETREAAFWQESLAIARENPKYNIKRPVQIVDGKVRKTTGANGRNPLVQGQIDTLVQEAADLGHKLDRRRCLTVVKEQVLAIKEGREARV